MTIPKNSNEYLLIQEAQRILLMEVEMGCSKTKTQNLPHNSKFSIKQILITQNDLAGIIMKNFLSRNKFI